MLKLELKLQTLAIWCEELIHLKRPWCWERLRAGGEGDNKGWDGWMASPTQWTWVWVNFRSWWWTGRPGVLQSMGSQRVRHDWATELNWTEQLKQTTCKISSLIQLLLKRCVNFCYTAMWLSYTYIFFFIFFSIESTLCMKRPKHWSFSFNINPSNEQPGLISFRMDWLALAVQGTLKSFLQHHSSKASILRRSAFFSNA